MKYFFAFTLLFAITLPVLAPVVAEAQSSIIPCGLQQSGGKTTDECTFADLVTLAQNLIEFLIFRIAAPLGAVMFAYAGFLYVTNNGNEGQVAQAHQVFLYVFWGFVVCLSAWLLVNFIVSFFLGTGSAYNFLG
jgi:hypothetical protein